MVLILRCLRLAALTSSLAAATFGAVAQPLAPASAPEPTPEPAGHPALNGELFYELLVGELSVRAGDMSSGYALVLDAARRTGEAQLYQRATDIALQSRSGDAALAAARAWQDAHPQSREANRYLLQILIALNRIGDTALPLQKELAQTPANGKLTLLNALPQMYSRASNKPLAAQVVEQALENELLQPVTGTAAWVTLGRLRLAAADKAGALAAAQRASAQAPDHDNAARLALELLDNGVAEADALVQQYLTHPRSLPELRMGYARVLVGQQRLPEARKQLNGIIQEMPQLPEAWLLMGSLQFEAGELAEAKASADRFIELNAQTEDDNLRERGFTQAYLLHAYIAERQGDYAGADQWLNRIENPSEVLGAQVRRASLMARQGKLGEARALIRNLPASSLEERRLKLLAEVQLLKDARQFQEAYKVQTEVVALSPDDGDLVYDQAMLAEKAGNPQKMESLLRGLIARQPKNHHALNALGYAFAERGVHLNEARELIKRALELSPGDAYITDSLGWVEFRMGNRHEALRLLQQAFATKPDAEIAAHLGEVLWSLGDKAAAQAIWKQGLALNPEHDTLRETLKRFDILR